MTDEKLVEVYSGGVVCPDEDCGFTFEMANARSEEEGSEILMAVVRAHGRFAHGSMTYFDPHIHLTETTRIHQLAEGRPKRPN